jgi:hypothetical protein
MYISIWKSIAYQILDARMIYRKVLSPHGHGAISSPAGRARVAVRSRTRGRTDGDDEQGARGVHRDTVHEP